MNSRIRIGGAFLLGAVIIFSATLARSAPTDPAANTASAVQAIGGTSERTYIPTADSDSDGTKDWKEEVDSVLQQFAEGAPEINLDGEGGAETSTLTSTFARSFFENYFLSNASGALTPENQADFVSQYIEKAKRDVRDTPLTRKDVVVGEESDSSKRAYGNAVAFALNPHIDPDGESVLILLERALFDEDETAIMQLSNIARAYEEVLADTLATPAPPSLVGTHLTLANAYQALKNDTGAMAEAKSDPLLALLRMRRYAEDIETMRDALTRIYAYLQDIGTRYSDDEPASGAVVEILPI